MNENNNCIADLKDWLRKKLDLFDKNNIDFNRIIFDKCDPAGKLTNIVECIYHLGPHPNCNQHINQAVCLNAHCAIVFRGQVVTEKMYDPGSASSSEIFYYFTYEHSDKRQITANFQWSVQ